MKRPIKQRSRFQPRVNRRAISQSTCLCLMLCAAMSSEARENTEADKGDSLTSTAATAAKATPLAKATPEEVAPY